jgi:phage gp45-like
MSVAKRLWDRAIIMMGLGRGTTAVTDGGPIRTVQIIFVTTGEIRDGVPVMQHYGFASRPHAGCDYTAMTLSGDPTKSLVIASNDQRFRVTLAEGEVALHDDLGQKFHLTRTGWDIADANGNSIVSSATGVAIVSPALTHNGKNIGSTHVHTGVTSGPDDTGPPAG